MIGLVAATARGRAAARRLELAWPEARRYPGRTGDAVRRAFAECDAVVCFLAVGAVVRIIGPLLRGKDRDPAVVCVDEAARFAVAVLGGHAAGGNALTARVAAELGCIPVVTTASDAVGATALDDFGADLGLRLTDREHLPAVAAAMLSGERVTLCSHATWPLPPLPPNVVRTTAPEPPHPAIVVSDRDPAVARPHPGPVVVYRPPSLVVGIGASRGAPADEILALVDAALADAGLAAASVRGVATVDAKRDEPGLRAAAEARGWAVTTYPPGTLAGVDVPNPSEVVRAAVGTPSVAEAAALHAGDADRVELLVPKRASAHATVAVARHRPRGRLTLVGLGPGSRDLLPERAAAAVRRASVVVGLDQYVDAVRDLIRPGAQVLEFPLGAEEQRAREAVEQARAGHAVVLLGSGDAGVYAMASPALRAAGDAIGSSIDVDGVPGITAALAAASLLGAPLGHDHAVISLSDLHTPWPAIEERLRAAAAADLVVALYNPRSRARTGHLAAALRILAEHRPPHTPVGVVWSACRPDERVLVTRLDAVPCAEVDMRAIVIVGSSQTRTVAGRMVTPRGYRWEPSG